MAVLSFLAYFLPSAIALLRTRKAGTWIIIINLLLGWTLVGWVVALVWALTGKSDPASKPRSNARATVFRAFVVLGIGSLVTIPFVLPSVKQPVETKIAQNIVLDAAGQRSSPAASAAEIPPATPIPRESTPSPTPEPTPTPTPFAKRVVTYDLQGEKPDKDDMVAIAIIKKIKWSRNGDPVLAAQEDAAQFLKVAVGMKEYPNFQVRNIVVSCGTDIFDKSIEIADTLRSQGVKEDEMDKAIAAQNPRTAYMNTMDVVLGGNADNYWVKALGKMPVANWGDGGIIDIGDLIIKNLNDPKSYKFDHFTVNVGKYNGQSAWKVDYWYRAKNGFGGLILGHNYFYVKDDTVIGAEEPKTSE